MSTATRNSKQRDAILSTLKSTKTHPSAEWVYEKLKPDFPSLSLATVYRNLNRFCEDGKANRLDVGDGTVRYDGFIDPHAHFYCSHCGKVIDIEGGTNYTPDIEEKYDIKLEGFSLVFFGKCKNCLV